MSDLIIYMEMIMPTPGRLYESINGLEYQVLYLAKDIHTKEIKIVYRCMTEMDTVLICDEDYWKSNIKIERTWRSPWRTISL